MYLSGAFYFLAVVSLITLSRARSLLAQSEDADNPMFRSDYFYNEKVSAFYKLHEEPATWEDAKNRCHHEGAILHTPLNKHLVDAVKEIMTNSSNTESIFTGLGRDSNGHFFDINTDTSSLNLTASKNSRIFCKTFQYNGSIANEPCYIKKRFVCYKFFLNDRIKACGTSDADYKLYNSTGKCYKFHKTLKSLYEAKSTCAAEGSYLAIVKNEAQSRAISHLFNTFPPGSFSSPTLWVNVTFIGFSYNYTTKRFETIDGWCGLPVIIPDELPSLLSLAYSKIPPIKKGTDSRIGFGYAFGNQADFQIVLELGPQTNTNQIGQTFPTNTKRQAPQIQSAAKVNKNKEKFLQSEAGQYLQNWAKKVKNPSKTQQNPTPLLGEVPNLEDSVVELIKNEKGEYEIHQPKPDHIPQAVMDELKKLYGQKREEAKNLAKKRTDADVKKITEDLSDVDLD